jgi:hypothetical protein
VSCSGYLWTTISRTPRRSASYASVPTIIPRDALRQVSARLREKTGSTMELRWAAIDKEAARGKKRLRPLAMTLEFSTVRCGSPWLAALRWMKDVFSRGQTLDQRSLTELPEGTIPQRLRSSLLVLDESGTPKRLVADRYELWVYRQIRKRLDAGELHLDDSIQYRAFGDELVPLEQKEEVLRQLDIPWLRRPVEAELDALFAELDQRWVAFERALRRGTPKHLQFEAATQILSWRREKVKAGEDIDPVFYARLGLRDIADIFRFVNQRCDFLSALTPLQPRYAKKVADDNSLMAVILAQAMNHGHLRMAETSDIPYHMLEETYKQCLRLSGETESLARRLPTTGGVENKQRFAQQMALHLLELH